MRFYRFVSALVLVLIFGTGCVYYNTFYLAKKNFGEAENKREKTGSEDAGNAAQQYRIAVEKCLKVITDHPDSKYVDDALYIIGKSYYHMGDFSKAERKFRELLAAYPESEYSEAGLFYLGKCRVAKEEYILARQAFIQVDSLTRNKKWKAEAQLMIGEIEFNERNFQEAIKYYTTYLEKFGDAAAAANVQLKIGQAFDSIKDYESSKNAYLKVADYKPSDSLYFLSRFSAGESYYIIGEIDSGYAVFEKLAKDEKYYSQAGRIRLKLAEAQAIRGEYSKAVEEYGKISQEFQKTDPAAKAYFEMGEIYMRQFNDLEGAKAMYDSSKSAFRRSDVYQLAMERSASISKLSKFREQATPEDLDSAALNQFQLAEIYLIDLENPDTALVEFGLVIDSFPASSLAPRALMARGYIFSKYLNQPDSARACYRKLMTDYPASDDVEEAARELQIDLEQMDIDYAGNRYRRAEDLYFEKHLVDSAMIVLQSIIDDFPNSKYVPQAAYAKAWMIEKNVTPEEWNPEDTSSVPDSTIILAYLSVAEEYDGSIYADSALAKLGQKRVPKPKKPVQQEEQKEEPQEQEEQEESADTTVIPAVVIGDDTLDIRALIDTLHLVDGEPAVEGPFEYPPSAYWTKFEGYVGFMVKIDFLGKPYEWHILQSSGVKEIDEATTEALRYTEFDIGEIPPEYVDQWQFYRFKVELPLEVKGRQ